MKINDYTIELPNPKSWDHWFYNLATVVGSNSKCLSRKIGAIIILDKTLISTGYNGAPRGTRSCDERWLFDGSIREEYNKRFPKKEIKHLTKLSTRYKNEFKGKCPRRVLKFKSGEGLDWCVAGHAERNAIVNAARLGLHELKGTTMYMTCAIPCTPCLIEIINAGIKEIVVSSMNVYDISAQYLLEDSNLKVRLFDFIEKEKDIE